MIKEGSSLKEGRMADLGDNRVYSCVVIFFFFMR